MAVGGKMSHIVTEGFEQKIIRLTNSFARLRHDFCDAGAVKSGVNSVETRLMPLDRPEDMEGMGVSGASDMFLGLFLLGRDTGPCRRFLAGLDGFASRNSLKLSKADVTFLTEGKSYAVLSMAYDGKRPPRIAKAGYGLVGTCDSFVLGRHFLAEKPERRGFYSACAAVSDIGAAGATPGFLSAFVLNPLGNGFARRYVDGVKKACRFMKVKKVEVKPFQKDPGMGAMSSTLTALGCVRDGEALSMKGLEPGMRIYIVGKIGGASALGYDVPEDYLKGNLDPSLRGRVFAALRGKGLVTDVSDGLHKSLGNFLRYADRCGIVISLRRLAGSFPREMEGVTVRDALYGGDDYCLAVATNAGLDGMDGVNRIGTVVEGNCGMRFTR